MTRHDPPPLRLDCDNPPELRDALWALRNEGRDAARITRVAQTLGPLLDAAPPPIGGLARWLRPLRGELHTAKIAVTALALGGGALWLARPSEATRPAPSARVAVAASALPEPAEPLAPSVAAAEIQPGAQEVSFVPVPRVDPPAPRSARSGPSPRKITRTGKAQHAPSPSADTRVPFSSTSSSMRGTSVVQEETSREQLEVAPPPPPAPPPQESEFSLLLHAREQMKSDPRSALRLLEEHKARFPAGMLAPEREVLAIEALEKTGQSRAAAERVRAFRERYPESLYRSRLEGPQR